MTTPVVAAAPVVAADASTTGGRPPRSAPWRRREKLIGLAAVAPAIVLVLGFMVYPVAYAVWISFNKTNGVRFDFVGLDNYTKLLADPLLHKVFLTNLIFLISVPLVILAALVCSVLLYERIRGWRLFRVLFFVPNVLSTAVIGLMFKSLFSYRGPINAVLQQFGIPPVDFFSGAGSAIFVIIIALVWSGFGYQTIILLSGLSSINPEIFEAATVDGAGWWKRLWYITLPNIRGVLALVSILNVLYTFTALFGFIFVMTAGGPGYDTTTLDYLIYTLAFSSTRLGEGSALAVMVFLLIGTLTAVQLRFFRASEDD
ncbi:carbohydrate ABC transporter permease [Herbiconiux sp. L3-i23]|uniref:carbohydrate ABC transporter permease n=1 Tax=Herbiconiux sp. L3-i23 TaxID=2905871 RepID=UPI002051D211|nr:sugar ABC transporter permease [Herbiconiux sp. L3-i23]BDI24029.1 lactose ABC transporter permease [Herbiconiux sp. L3-i23]